MNSDERKILGTQRVGVPANEIGEAVGRLSEMDEYNRIRFDAVEFYCHRLLFRELITLIDESLDMQQLADLDPDVLKVVYIMLLRDMMQTHRQLIVIDPEKQCWDTERIEQFIVGLFYESQTPMEPYSDWLDVIEEGEEEPSAMLISGLAGQLGVDAKMLYLYHQVACEVTQEETLSG